MKQKINPRKTIEASATTVGYDGKRALRNGTGLGNYSRYAIDAMSLLFPKNDYRIYAASAADTSRIDYLLERSDVELVTAKGNPRFKALWRTFGLTRQLADDGVDVYHGLSNEVPVGIERSLPSVVTMHDVIWRRYPKDYSAIDRRLYDFKYGGSARRATRVIAISECTKRDLMSDFGIPEEKIDVIYQGIDGSFKPLHGDEVRRMREKYGLTGRYIAAVGTVQGRKNQLLAVKALSGLPEDVKLVIAGRRTAYAEQMERCAAAEGVTHRIVWIENAPFEDLPALYSGAEFSSYTSRYEGFGLPVVESIACHTPVIACTGSCLEEAGGGGAIYVAPDDAQAYAEAARRLLDDRYLRDKMTELGLRHIKRFDVKTFAEKTMKCYTKAMLEFYLK